MLVFASMADFSGALVHLAGFLFVVFVLSLLWLVIELIGAGFRKGSAPKPAASKAATTPAPVAASATTDGEFPEEELVVIASTVAMMLGRKPHRLVSIRTSGADWSREGRRQHLQSHRVGR